MGQARNSNLAEVRCLLDGRFDYIKRQVRVKLCIKKLDTIWSVASRDFCDEQLPRLFRRSNAKKKIIFMAKQWT